jgi:hypothetical protein
MLGRSIWSVLNSYYAVLKEKQYYPDEIILFTEGKKTDTLKSNTKTTTTGLKIISENFGITPRIKSEHLSEIEYDIEYGDFIKAGKEISKLIQKRKKDGDTVAIDITPGKKNPRRRSLTPYTYRRSRSHILSFHQNHYSKSLYDDTLPDPADQRLYRTGT